MLIFAFYRMVNTRDNDRFTRRNSKKIERTPNRAEQQVSKRARAIPKVPSSKDLISQYAMERQLWLLSITDVNYIYSDGICTYHYTHHWVFCSEWLLTSFFQLLLWLDFCCFILPRIAYFSQRRISYWKISPKRMKPPTIESRPSSPHCLSLYVSQSAIRSCKQIK